jgi:hypothetical protein
MVKFAFPRTPVRGSKSGKGSNLFISRFVVLHILLVSWLRSFVKIHFQNVRIALIAMEWFWPSKMTPESIPNPFSVTLVVCFQRNTFTITHDDAFVG